MTTDHRLPTATISRQSTADGSDTLYSQAYQQSYHSKHGALTESESVFLKTSGVAERLQKGQASRVLEVGFGTGLNFFLTAKLALQCNTPLHYIALEKHLLSVQILEQLNHRSLLDLESLYQAFLDWRSALGQFEPQMTCNFTDQNLLRLDFLIGDATQSDLPALDYHAIYHDAFSPEVNPELWTEAFFAKLQAVLVSGGCLSTYSVKGTVRRALQTVGFTVEKLPGPPGKREILRAIRA